jgi:hypothetical protein
VGSGSEFPTLLVGFHFFSPKFPVPEPQQTRQKNQVFIRQNTEHRENRHQPKRQTEVDSSRTQHVLTHRNQQPAACRHAGKWKKDPHPTTQQQNKITPKRSATQDAHNNTKQQLNKTYIKTYKPHYLLNHCTHRPKKPAPQKKSTTANN